MIRFLEIIAVLVFLVTPLLERAARAADDPRLSSMLTEVPNRLSVDLISSEKEYFVLRLPEANSSGYQWKIVEGDSSVVTCTREKNIHAHMLEIHETVGRSRDIQETDGGNQLALFTFKALPDGVYKYKFIHVRAWGSEPPTQSLELQITVKANP